ncbi:hypothetical protein ACFPLB_03935 [Aquamicrobium segne]|uniref:Uncharacterized protein n=1 Tax=Aquamicrobium segne TaxID=469547 RepID=A0ABW0GZE0_9HYPH
MAHPQQGSCAQGKASRPAQSRSNLDMPYNELVPYQYRKRYQPFHEHGFVRSTLPVLDWVEGLAPVPFDKKTLPKTLWKEQGQVLLLFNESGYQIALKSAALSAGFHQSHWDSNSFRQSHKTQSGKILFFNISLDMRLFPFGVHDCAQPVDEHVSSDCKGMVFDHPG